MSTVISILAGGAGQRIGGAKPGRHMKGVSLLNHTLMVAQDWDAPVILNLRNPDQITGHHGTVILDNPDIPGPLGGLASALSWAEANGYDRVLTLACDMPFLPADLLSRLDSALTKDKGVALATSGGRLHPVCALWHRTTLPVLIQRASAGQLSLNGLSEAVGRVLVNWSIEPRDPFLNINTLDDLAHAEAMTI